MSNIPQKPSTKTTGINNLQKPEQQQPQQPCLGLPFSPAVKKILLDRLEAYTEQGGQADV